MRTGTRVEDIDEGIRGTVIEVGRVSQNPEYRVKVRWDDGLVAYYTDENLKEIREIAYDLQDEI